MILGIRFIVEKEQWILQFDHGQSHSSIASAVVLQAFLSEINLYIRRKYTTRQGGFWLNAARHAIYGTQLCVRFGWPARRGAIASVGCLPALQTLPCICREILLRNRRALWTRMIWFGRSRFMQNWSGWFCTEIWNCHSWKVWIESKFLS